MIRKGVVAGVDSNGNYVFDGDIVMIGREHAMVYTDERLFCSVAVTPDGRSETICDLLRKGYRLERIMALNEDSAHSNALFEQFIRVYNSKVGVIR